MECYQIKYVETKNNSLTFSDERQFHSWWMESSSLSVQHHEWISDVFCSHFLSKKNPKTMSKRSIQQRKPGEEPVLAKLGQVSLVSKRVSVNQSPMMDSGISESMSEEVRGNSSHGQAETENPNMIDDYEEVRGDSSHGLPEWLQEFEDNLKMKVFQNTETLPVLLMNYLQSREQKWYRVSKVSILTSRRTEIAISAWESKLQGLLAEDALVRSCPDRKNLVIKLLWITKFLVKKVNLETIMDTV